MESSFPYFFFLFPFLSYPPPLSVFLVQAALELEILLPQPLESQGDRQVAVLKIEWSGAGELAQYSDHLQFQVIYCHLLVSAPTCAHTHIKINKLNQCLFFNEQSVDV